MTGAPPREWRIVSPAPATAALALAGPWPRMRRLVLAQVRSHQSAAIYRGSELLALAMFAPFDGKRLEIALAIEPVAARHMRRLVRLAHLTLTTIAQSQSIVAVVRPGNLAGERMARASGFRAVRQTGLWIFRKGRRGHESTDGRRQGGGAGSTRAKGGERPAACGTENAGTAIRRDAAQSTRAASVHVGCEIEPGLIAADV